MNLAPGQEAQLRQMEPLTLLGMHRSGTSLVVRLLADLGIHMGSWLSRDAEAVHFQQLNRRIYGAAGSKWGDVDGLLEAMEAEPFVEQQTAATRQALFYKRPFYKRQPVIADFFGPELWAKVSRNEPFPWGWKDPRTTLTFPIWLRLFPEARWVHILRNGIDVTISIHRRSIKQRRKLRNHLFPIDYSPRTLDFGYGFRLWELYVTYILEHKHLIPAERYLEMRYEDLLTEPLAQLRQLVDFAGYAVEEDRLLAVSQRINKARLENLAYAADYRDEIPDLAARPLMVQLGYSYRLPGEGL